MALVNYKDRHSCAVTSCVVTLKRLSILYYKMDCNSEIHNDLKNMEECTCPFCDQQLVEFHKVVEPCCGEQNIETANGMNICVNCGLVHGYDYATEYFNFYDNMYRIRRKSV